MREWAESAAGRGSDGFGGALRGGARRSLTRPFGAARTEIGPEASMRFEAASQARLGAGVFDTGAALGGGPLGDVAGAGAGVPAALLRARSVLLGAGVAAGSGGGGGLKSRCPERGVLGSGAAAFSSSCVAR